METAEPIDLTDVRSYLAMDPDDTSEDPVLTESISFCRDRLEAVLPYHLAERPVTFSKALCGWCLMPQEVIELKGPVLAVEGVSLTLPGNVTAEVPPTCWDLFRDVMTVRTRDALSELDLSDRPIGITVAYRAGAHVPPLVKNALLMMVRNRYERRDEDPLSPAVLSTVYTETRPNA